MDLPPRGLVDLVAAVGALAVLVAVTSALGGGMLPGEVLVAGAATGCLSGLIAVGLVLVHRAQRVVSFAAVAVGGPSAALGVSLLARGWPWPVALAVVSVTAPVAAVGCEIVVRRFAGEARTVATVVTLGLAQVLLALEQVVVSVTAPESALPAQVATPFGRVEHQLGIVRLTGDHAVAVLLSLVLVASVALLLARTDLGLALRAISSRPRRVAGLGLSVARTTQAAWVLAAVLAAVALFLRAPLLGGATGGGLGGPVVLLPVLVAGTVAAFEDLRRAFLAGLLLGTVQAAVLFSTGRANAAVAAVAVIALAVTLVAPRLRTRGELAGAALWSATPEPPRLPADLARLWPVRLGRIAIPALAVAALVAAPAVLGAGDTGRLSIAVLYGLLALAVVVATGWGGQLHLGAAGAAGAGALVAGGLATRGGETAGDFVVTLLVAAATGATVTVVAGLSALRRPGVLPGIATLGLATGVAALLGDPWSRGLAPPPGALVARPVLFGRWDVAGPAAFHLVCVVALLAGVAAVVRFRNSRVHRLTVVARDDRRFLPTTGRGAARPVLAALAASGCLAGAAGALLAYQQGTVDASTFSPELGLDVLTVVVAGGVASPLGAVVAAAALVGTPLLFPDVPAVAALASGAGVVLVLLLLPGGAAAGAARTRLAVAQWAAGGGRVDVPIGATPAGGALLPRPSVEVPTGAVALEVARRP